MPEGEGLVVDKVLQESAKTDNDGHQQGVCLIYSIFTGVNCLCVCVRPLGGIPDEKCTHNCRLT